MTFIARGLQINKAHPLAQGLVGYWPLNEGFGTKAYDLSGNNNTGTLTNFALSGATSNWCGSPTGGGLNFDGANDFIGTFTKSISPPGARTLSCWIRKSSNTRSGLICTTIAAGGQGFALVINRTVAGNITYIHSVGGFLEVSVSIASNVWYNIGVTYNGSTNVIMYLNGKNIGSSSSITPEPVSSSNGTIGIEDSTGTNPFNGFISEVRAYNRALSPQEMQTLYNNPHADLIQTKPYFKNK
jgi:hypothetical protein